MRRIRRAMDSVTTTSQKYGRLAEEMADLLDKLEDEGIEITVGSLAGFDLPETTFRIRIGGDVKGKDGNADV